MSEEIEAVIWCPACEKEKFRVLRMPSQNEGVFEHKVEAIVEGIGPHARTCNECGGNLARKPNEQST